MDETQPIAPAPSGCPTFFDVSERIQALEAENAHLRLVIEFYKEQLTTVVKRANANAETEKEWRRETQQKMQRLSNAAHYLARTLE